MTPETVQKHLLRQPFQPFRVCLSDGSAYEVRQPEMVLVMQREVRGCELIELVDVSPYSSSAIQPRNKDLRQVAWKKSIVSQPLIIALPKPSEQFPRHTVYCDLLHITRIEPINGRETKRRPKTRR